jgi:hypothetical protein
MSQTPAVALHRLLQVNFAPTVPAAGGKKMILSSIYSLTVALPAKTNLLSTHLPDQFISGFVRNHPALRFLTCQTRKFPPNEDANDTTSSNRDIEVWTILSSSTFAKKCKAPQEFLPDETVHTVTGLLLAAVEEALTGQKSMDNISDNIRSTLEAHVLDRRLQLWGAALPLNVWSIPADTNTNTDDDKNEGGGSTNKNDDATSTPPHSKEQALPAAGFLYDAEHAVGACGDWLVQPSIAGAWSSGRMLAEHVLQQRSNPMTAAAAQSHGLETTDGTFVRSESASKLGIGSLLSTDNNQEKKKHPAPPSRRSAVPAK